MKRSPFAWFVAAALAYGPQVSANGRFPLASQVVFDPADEAHLLVSTTFGLLESRDTGKTFSYVCEFALGLGAQEDPMLAITSESVTVAATFSGIVTSADGCAYDKSKDLEGEIIPDLALSRADGRTLWAFRTVGLGEGRFDSELVRSEDDGESWVRLAPALPDDLLPLTIDVAPSNDQRIYISARASKVDDYATVLLRSDDAGQSFERTPIPDSSGQRLAYIAAVDPNDADRLYVRVNDPAGTVLWMSADAGQSFDKIFTANGALLGFATSEAGDAIAFGGPIDGVWLGEPDGTNLERRSDVPATCLGFRGDGLYACADEAQAGFALGVSRDLGASFDGLVRFADLCGPTACGPETQVGGECLQDWNRIGPVVGATCGLEPVAEAGSSGRGGTNGTARGGSNGTARGGVGGASGGEMGSTRGSDGGCAVSGAWRGNASAGLMALFGAWLTLRVAKRRSLRHPAQA